MIKNKPEGMGLIEVDLTGPNGNAFYLLGLANQLAKKSGMDPAPILSEMKCGNYEHLVETFDEHFGDMVVLYR